MVAKLIIWLTAFFIIGLVSCSPINTTNSKIECQSEMCTRQEMRKLALNHLRKKSVLPVDYEVSYDDKRDQNTTEVQIVPTNPNTKGGGGKFLFAKQTCEILRIELYQ